MASAAWPSEIDAAWRDIEEWYRTRGAAHLLLPGASDRDIDKAEARLGCAFPEPLRASLGRHNGTRLDAWPNGTLLATGSIIAATELWRRVADHGDGVPADFTCPDAERGLLRPGWWHEGWIAIDEDRLGNATAVDTAPGNGGHHGQVLEMDHVTGPILSSGDYVEYLREAADALEVLRVVDGTYLDENDVWEGDANDVLFSRG